VLILLALPVFGAYADVCGGSDIAGAYGFQLVGTNTISGAPQPAVTLGRLVFDGSGQVSGYASVNFNGLFLGNPVTGTYEFGTDCTLTWSLQDDSGAYQHFTGKAAPGGARAEFHQSDPDTGGRGVLQKTPADCNAAAFKGQYAYSSSGVSTPYALGGSGTSLTEKGTVDADGAGNFTLKGADQATAGTYEVDSECFVEIRYTPASGDEINLRGILVNGGKEVMAIHTDPEVTGTVKLTAR
jgi:hypothetical protein